MGSDGVKPSSVRTHLTSQVLQEGRVGVPVVPMLLARSDYRVVKHETQHGKPASTCPTQESWNTRKYKLLGLKSGPNRAGELFGSAVCIIGCPGSGPWLTPKAAREQTHLGPGTNQIWSTAIFWSSKVVPYSENTQTVLNGGASIVSNNTCS